MHKIQHVSNYVGMSSLVCFRSDPPLSRGNYFSFGNGLRAVNFWAENANYVKKQFGIDKIECAVFEETYPDGYTKKWAVVIDKRIPEDCYYDSLCFTGYGGPSKDMILEMISVMPYKNDEKLLEYTDFDLWCEKTGHSPIFDKEGNRIGLKREISTKSRQLEGGWTMESLPDVGNL